MTDRQAYSPGGDVLKIFMAAGEVSGDRQAAHLARAIRAARRDVLLYGSGGESMQNAGVDIRCTTAHLGSVGFQESLRFVRPLRAILLHLRQLLRNERPDFAILVDNEGFNGLLAKVLAREAIPFLYYFPPQVWLWGEWRARGIARRATAIITPFAAEAEIYRREGGNVHWVGHPLIDLVHPDGDAEERFRLAGLDPGRPTIAVLPGSRVQEIEQLALPMLQAARIIKDRHPEIQIILPVAASHLDARIRKAVQHAGMGGEIVPVSNSVYSLLGRCDAALVSSGTATLELALLEVPMVVAYRVKPLTYFLARRLVKADFISMPNILFGGPVVPEFLQTDATPGRLSDELLAILESRNRREAMRGHLRSLRPMLGECGVLERAAQVVLYEADRASARRHLSAA